MSEAVAEKDEAVPKPDAATEKVVYNDDVVRWFALASVVFAIVGMLVGVIIALQLAVWQANVHPILTYGRLRPLHTNAVIFAFVGNMIFAGMYYSTQRLLRTRMASDLLSKIHFWGWQLIIVSAAISLPLGWTTGKEYAELEWPIDIAITLVWVVFAINFFWTLAIRRERHLYVAIWFYIATIVTVAVLHIVNSLEIPVFGMGRPHSYSIYGGAKDALVQWWYGHNAVAFFLTTPVLGIMYYFVPKAVERPVYSYRLSIVHFWALVFMYIWAGPHHLLNTALPDWAQTLGMVFSVMLWAPSWGGMVNGLLTLRGAWDKLRKDPIVKFLAAGVTFYGMSTFEGPLLSIRSVNGLAHYTDWIIGHVHSGALGWNGFMAAGVFYWLFPKLWGTKLWSKKLAEYHFYIGTFGILLYMGAMWVSGVTQGMMWRQVNADGSLAYPNFVETLMAIRPLYWLRLVGGSMYLVGFIMMATNLVMTARSGAKVDGTITVPALAKEPAESSWTSVLFGKPVLFTLVACAIVGVAGFVKGTLSMVVIIAGTAVAVLGTVALQASAGKDGKPSWHRLVEGRALIFTVLALIAVLVGGVTELVPTLLAEPPMSNLQPYTALEIEGRDVYLREGCYVCHSQMVRPFKFEAQRYGEPNTLADSQYDHPFQWGSKRTGPDLGREGGKYPNSWHYKHLINPRDISAGSNMPKYAQLADQKIDFGVTGNKVGALRAVGVPYTDAEVSSASADAKAQGEKIADGLKGDGITVGADSEMVALISYLQRIGKTPQRGQSGPAITLGGN